MVLDVDEGTPGAQRHHVDAKTGECCVADVEGGLTGHEHLDMGLGKGDVRHGSISCLQLQLGNRDGRGPAPYGEIDRRKRS